MLSRKWDFKLTMLRVLWPMTGVRYVESVTNIPTYSSEIVMEKILALAIRSI